MKYKYISTLPHEYFHLAQIRAVSPTKSGVKFVYKDNLVKAFDWELTKEGYIFWKLVSSAHREDELPPIPDKSKIDFLRIIIREK